MPKSGAWPTLINIPPVFTSLSQRFIWSMIFCCAVAQDSERVHLTLEKIMMGKIRLMMMMMMLIKMMMMMMMMMMMTMIYDDDDGKTCMRHAKGPWGQETLPTREEAQR